MEKLIKGLHHVTSMAADANENNQFFTKTLGLRRVKKTVNFDAPEVYHLYYGDEIGTPGSVMTYFPFAQMQRGKRGLPALTLKTSRIPKWRRSASPSSTATRPSPSKPARSRARQAAR